MEFTKCTGCFYFNSDTYRKRKSFLKDKQFNKKRKSRYSYTS